MFRRIAAQILLEAIFPDRIVALRSKIVGAAPFHHVALIVCVTELYLELHGRTEELYVDVPLFFGLE